MVISSCFFTVQVSHCYPFQNARPDALRPQRALAAAEQTANGGPARVEACNAEIVPFRHGRGSLPYPIETTRSSFNHLGRSRRNLPAGLSEDWTSARFGRIGAGLQAVSSLPDR
jgi:hypothetical protein